MKINSRVEKGVLIRNRKNLTKAIKSFEGKDIIITIEKKTNKRTLPQNAYYWGCVIPIIKNGIRAAWGSGLTDNEAHEFLKGRFNVSEYSDNKLDGEVIHLPKSTTKLTTSDFMDYLADIKAFALDYLGVDIPDPEQQIEINY